ncbi:MULTISPECIES: hypothetical protein [unclassified Methylobacterium]|jgi:hypothetical protein|uniref:hypothetical protein n=1 Tax=unclassified Methylobacterium TaxID=2615210 RepID=UPI001FEF81D2|nr:hypothetical protein [Methylobacterium sp. 2A]
MASFGRVAMVPLWVAQLATGAKSFVDNPILGSERLNRAGLHTLRVRLAHAMAGLRRRQLAHLVSAQDRADFARDGFIKRADFMPADLHRAVYAEVTGARPRAASRCRATPSPAASPSIRRR